MNHSHETDDDVRKAKRNDGQIVCKSTRSRYAQPGLQICRIEHDFFDDVYDSVFDTHVRPHHSYSLRPDQHVEFYTHAVFQRATCRQGGMLLTCYSNISK